MKHINKIFKLNKNVEDINFNLHNHSKYSDGQHSVRELISEAVYKTITHFSLTDHDTIDAYLKGNAMTIAKGFGLNMIPGVEATVKATNEFVSRVHMLLYFDENLFKDKQFLKDFNDTIGRARSKELFDEKIKKYNSDYGLNLSTGDFKNINRDNFYKTFNGRDFYDAILSKYPNFDKEEVSEIISSNSPSYIKPGTSISDLMYLKNRYDMLSVFAHPYAEPESTNDSKKYEIEVNKYIQELIELGFLNGLEKFHPKSGEENFAKFDNFNVELFTGGSDTHNKEGKLSLNDIGISNIINHDFNRLSLKGDLAVMVGRMNPPHIGHIRVIKNALKQNSKLMLVLGSASTINEKNPFSFEDIKFILETYFKDEIREGRLIITGMDDVNDDRVWVESIGNKIREFFPEFNKKLNFYGGDFKEDMAILALKEHINELKIEDVNFIQNARTAFDLVYGKDRYEISATNLRKALSEGNYDLAKKFMNDEIAEIVITKWKEKNNELRTKKVFIVSPPEGNRNYFSSKKIKDSIEETFNGKYIVDVVNDADIIVVLGGDGSLLRALKEYGDLNIPFYPLAAGTANAIPSNYEQAYQIFSEDIDIKKINLIEAQVFDDEGNLISNLEGFNDIYIKAQNGEMGHLMVEADSYPIRSVIGDGLAIAAPIGTTAYHKNAGGSVLDLENNGLAITDLISTKGRSDVVSNDSTIKITSIRGKFDIFGNNRLSAENFSMEIKKSDKFVEIILPKKEEFRQNRYKI